MWRCGDRGGIKGERGRKEFWLLNLNKITDVIWQVTIVTRKTVLYPQISSCYIPEYILHCVTLPKKKITVLKTQKTFILPAVPSLFLKHLLLYHLHDFWKSMELLDIK